MTDNTGLPVAGWHDDPEDPAQLRYWDGTAWTEHRSPKAVAAQPTTAQPTTAQPTTAQPTTAQPTTAQPATANAAAQGASAPKKSGAPWWLVAVIGVVTLFVGVGIGAAVGGGSDSGDDAVAAPTTSADEPPASDDAAVVETASGEPAPDASGGAGTATDPLAIGTPWTYDTSYFGEESTQWEGTLEGLVSLPVHEWDEDQDARCFAVIGTMSPTSIADDAFTNNPFDTPGFEVVVGGKVEDGFGLCDTEALDAAGYGAMWDAEVSVGTEYKFYDELFLPSSVTGDVELIVLGSASDADALFYEPTPVAVG